MLSRNPPTPIFREELEQHPHPLMFALTDYGEGARERRNMEF